ncbi:MAG: metallophosphoesterase, partial [Bacteroidota bacterium]
MSAYQRIHRSLDRAYRKSRKVKLDLDEAKWVLFSDHHRGSKDQADDFQQCEQTYQSALSHYFKEGFSLALLGDVEELWENKISIVLKKYQDVLKTEDDFSKDGRLLKIWGNHDDYWREKILFRHYFKDLFREVNCSECISFICYRDGVFQGEIVVLHGHQGSWTSEKFATISRFFVRYFWRYFQKITGYKLTSASKDLNLKSKTDHAMYDWASQNEKVLICGHTHQPVFMSGTHLDYLYNELNHAQNEAEVQRLESELSKHRD